MYAGTLSQELKQNPWRMLACSSGLAQFALLYTPKTSCPGMVPATLGRAFSHKSYPSNAGDHTLTLSMLGAQLRSCYFLIILDLISNWMSQMFPHYLCLFIEIPILPTLLSNLRPSGLGNLETWSMFGFFSLDVSPESVIVFIISLLQNTVPSWDIRSPQTYKISDFCDSCVELSARCSCFLMPPGSRGKLVRCLASSTLVVISTSHILIFLISSLWYFVFLGEENKP